MSVAEEVEEGTLLSVQVRGSCVRMDQWIVLLHLLIACSQCPSPTLLTLTALCVERYAWE